MLNFHYRIAPSALVLPALVLPALVLPALVLAALITLGSGGTQAAPQALALVATDGKVGLTCGARECSAEVTSFCLDAGRFSPPRGTEYRIAGGGQIRLIGTTQDGHAVVLDARSHLRFESARRHLAVRVSVDRAVLAALGVERIEIEIAENVALLPAPQPGDPACPASRRERSRPDFPLLRRSGGELERGPPGGRRYRRHTWRTGCVAHTAA